MKFERDVAQITPPAASSSARAVRSAVLEHPAVQAWAQLGAAEGSATAVERLQKKRKGCVYRLYGAAGGANVIAKVSTAERIGRERLVYEHVLPALSVPTVTYHGVVADPSGATCWLFVDDAGGEPYSPRSGAHRRLAAWWLGAVHTSAAEVAAARSLPEHDPSYYRRELQSARITLAANVSNPALDAGQLGLLHAVVRQCDVIDAHWTELEEWCAAVPPTFGHGDFAPKNMRVRHGPDGPRLLPFDWGSAGWGSPAADLVQRGTTTGDDWDYWAHPDLSAYTAAVRQSWPRLRSSDVRLLSVAGKLFRTLVCVRLEAPSFALDWVENAARAMSMYRAALADGIRSAGWEAAR
jgi:hypothetical protein